MAETFANLEGLQELAQQLQSRYSAWQYTTSGGNAYFAQPAAGLQYVKPEEFSGPEQVLSSLERAKALAAQSPSIKKSGIDAEIETIIKNFSGANRAISDVGAFLTRLVELYEQTEKGLRSRLDHSGHEYDSSGHRVYHYTAEPKAQASTSTYVSHALINEDGVVSFRNPFVAENGQYGIDLCLLEIDASRQTPSGTSHLSQKFICITAKGGVGTQTSDGDRSIGVDVGVSIVSAGAGRTDKGSNFGVDYDVSKGVGAGFTFNVTEHADGTMDTNVGIPGTPIGVTVHENSTFKDIGRFLSRTPSGMWGF